MRFDVEMTKNWLVSGRKRGDFVAKVRTKYVSHYLPMLSTAGWRNIFNVYYSNCLAPWRARTAPNRGWRFAFAR